MATQARSWLARVSVVAVVSLGALAGVASPAAAADPTLENESLSPNTITVGQESTLKFRIKGDPGTDVNGVTIQVDGGGACTSNCSPGKVTLAPVTGLSNEYQAKIKGNAAGQATVKVMRSGGQVGSLPLTINPGQQEPQTVGKLQGEVTNISEGKPVSGAVVTLTDGNGKAHTATTNSAGVYFFDGPDKKIAPGVLAVTATKDPLVPKAPRTAQVAAGKDAVFSKIEMELPAAATTAPPTPDATPTIEATDTTTAPPAPETTAAADSGGLDMMTWIMIIVGGLLVALGIGAIVLLLVRRNADDDDDDEDDEDEPVRGRPGPRGPQPGGYRPAPGVYGGGPGGAYGRPADPTMVARPGMNDAPTMMHRPGADQYGGPAQAYGQGQPPQQWGQPGYGPPSSGAGYGGGAQASGGGAYGNPQASGGGAYGNPQASGGGAYGNPQQQPGWSGYDQPGHGQPGYQPPQPGYDQPGQYEEPTQYAGPSSDGYSQPGYGQPGYEPGYGQQGYAPEGGGYAPDSYGAQQQDPYGGQPGYDQQQPGYPDDRRNRGDRRLDWLDD